MATRELGSIEANASMDNWDELVEFPDEFITTYISDKSRGYKFRLAYEELISNIIRASTSHQSSRTLSITLRCQAFLEEKDGERWFVLQTSDNADHFDPDFENRVPVDTEQPVKDRPIGGLGLFLIKSSVDQVNYRWQDDRNIYELWMNVQA